MELHQLRYFLTTLNEGSFSSAADKHRLTQQAISKSISRLEQELGTKLFLRDGHQLKPTAVGKMLAKHAQMIDAESWITGVSPGQASFRTQWAGLSAEASVQVAQNVSTSVTLTLDVTVPANTPADATVYISGNLEEVGGVCTSWSLEDKLCVTEERAREVTQSPWRSPEDWE